MIGLLGRPARLALVALGVIAAVRAVGTILIAEALATGIVSVIALHDGTADDRWTRALVVGAAGGMLRALAVWASAWTAQRARVTSISQLRRGLIRRALAGGGRPVGEVATLATRGLDDLDGTFVAVFPALVSAVVVPLVVGARILFADPLSALVIVLTIPLVPLFMILIGRHTRTETEHAADALLRLSAHVVELVRGLPVLLGLGRADAQARALDTLAEDVRRRTMRTLRTAFLSSLALELIATISVAIVAVFIGLRLVFGGMELEVGLLVLLLASECYTPFRVAGAAYHASEDGAVALRRVREAVDAPVSTPLWDDDPVRAAATAPRDVRIVGVSVRFPDRGAVVRDAWAATRTGTATLLDGESGSGKSTLLRVVAGRLGASDPGAVVEGAAEVTGFVTGVHEDDVAWVPQHPRTFADTPLAEVRLHAGVDDDAGHVLLAEVGLAGLADASLAEFSPGQLRRVAVARALGRVDAGAGVLLLDEPTAHLDAGSAEAVRVAIAARLPRAATFVASHDPRMQRLCVHRAAVGRPARRTDDEVVDVPSPAAEPASRTAAPLPRRAPLRVLAHLLRVRPGGLVLAVVLGVLATAFGVSQTALSGWLIVRASEQPPIMLLTAAIVGVRFFGLGRATLRYAERLQLHDVVFRMAGRLRGALWAALGAAGLAFPAIRRGPAVLDVLVGDVDRIRDEIPRVLLPPLVAVVSTTGLALVAGILLPDAAVPLLLLAAVLAVLVPLVVLAVDRHAAVQERDLRARIGRDVAALLDAGDDLSVHRVTDGPLAAVDTAEREAVRRARRRAAGEGLGGALVVAATTGAALATGALGAMSGAPGTVVAVVALATLALVDPGLEAAASVQRWPALRRSLGSAGGVLALAPEPPARTAVETSDAPGTGLVLDDVTARWPGSATPVFRGLSLRVEAGAWASVVGPSGAGKSTMLAVVTGHLAAERGHVRVDGAPVRLGSADAVAWCPQEAHLFDSSLRANLVLARAASDRPDDHELAEVLDRVGLGPWLRRLPAGLDTRLGAAGDRLSGGQRQRVAIARTLLTRAPVILLDEPTAHLDAAGAEALLAELRSGLRDRAVVCVTHDPRAAAVADRVLDLGAAAHPSGRRPADGLPVPA